MVVEIVWRASLAYSRHTYGQVPETVYKKKKKFSINPTLFFYFFKGIDLGILHNFHFSSDCNRILYLDALSFHAKKYVKYMQNKCK